MKVQVLSSAFLLLLALQSTSFADLEFRFLKSVGAFGTGKGRFSAPAGIIRQGGYFYICDSGNNRIVKFDSDLTPVDQFTIKSDDIFPLDRPTGIGSDAALSLWVVDSRNHRLVRFSDEGRVLGTTGRVGIGVGEFSDPKAISTDIEGNLLIADSGNDRIVTLRSDGSPLTEFGQVGEPDERLLCPQGVLALSQGVILVSDTGHKQVKLFDSFGKLRKIVLLLEKPEALSVDSPEGFYVADARRVVYFDIEGKILGVIGAPLKAPKSVVAYGDKVYVTDAGWNAVLVFEKVKK